jgi:hypothetical protein
MPGWSAVDQLRLAPGWHQGSPTQAHEEQKQKPTLPPLPLRSPTACVPPLAVTPNLRGAAPPLEPQAQQQLIDARVSHVVVPEDSAGARAAARLGLFRRVFAEP